MRIGIVTVTHNSADVLERFLDCIISQTKSHFRLFVIDNASSDASIARIKRRADPRIEIIANNKNAGVAAGNNQGIIRALDWGSDAVLFLNNDTEFPNDLIAILQNELTISGADMITPKINYYKPCDQIWCAGGHFLSHLARSASHLGLGRKDKGQFDEPAWVSYAPTCCMLIVARVFTNIGLMDEAYFCYWDDVDFMYRALCSQTTLLFTPSATVLHKVSSLTGGARSVFTVWYETRNQVYYIRKHFRSSRSVWLAVHGLRFVLRWLTGRDSSGVAKQRFKAFCVGLKMRATGQT